MPRLCTRCLGHVMNDHIYSVHNTTTTNEPLGIGPKRGCSQTKNQFLHESGLISSAKFSKFSRDCIVRNIITQKTTLEEIVGDILPLAYGLRKDFPTFTDAEMFQLKLICFNTLSGLCPVMDAVLNEFIKHGEMFLEMFGEFNCFHINFIQMKAERNIGDDDITITYVKPRKEPVDITVMADEINKKGNNPSTTTYRNPGED